MCLAVMLVSGRGVECTWRTARNRGVDHADGGASLVAVRDACGERPPVKRGVHCRSADKHRAGRRESLTVACRRFPYCNV
jgi:hypothetical protein